MGRQKVEGKKWRTKSGGMAKKHFLAPLANSLLLKNKGMTKSGEFCSLRLQITSSRQQCGNAKK
jgi:hypothetical protein